MSRSEKRAAEKILKGAGGYTTEEFASPKLRNKAKAERGHCRMTPAEYSELRLGRGRKTEARLEAMIEVQSQIRRQQRTLGDRRITGRQPGTKKPLGWFSQSEPVERSWYPKG